MASTINTTVSAGSKMPAARVMQSTESPNTNSWGRGWAPWALCLACQPSAMLWCTSAMLEVSLAWQQVSHQGCRPAFQLRQKNLSLHGSAAKRCITCRLPLR